MNKKNITPNPSQPVERIASGKLPSALAELSEEAIGGSVTSSVHLLTSIRPVPCAYDESVTSSVHLLTSIRPVPCAYEGDE